MHCRLFDGSLLNAIRTADSRGAFFNGLSKNCSFFSTQDTVIGLQALGAYAERIYDANFDVQLSVQNGEDVHNFTVSSDNSIVLQSYEVRLRNSMCNN